MENLRKQYRDLEMMVLRELRIKVEESNYTSSYTGEKAVPINDYHSKEITIYKGQIVFIGRHDELIKHPLFHYNLEDLITILSRLENIENPKQ